MGGERVCERTVKEITTYRIITSERESLLNAFIAVCRWIHVYYLWRPNFLLGCRLNRSYSSAAVYAPFSGKKTRRPPKVAPR